jgi:hypothetical protein
MKTILMSLVLATGLVTTAAFADDPSTCAITRGSLHSAVNVDPGYAGVQSVGPVQNTATGIKQMIVLQDSQKVVYEVGGCNHLNYSFSYPWGVASVEPLSDYDAKMLALQMLGQTVVVPGEYDKVQTLIDGVNTIMADDSYSAPKSFSTMLYFNCGDATCWIERPDHTHEFSVNYTFAL